MRSLISSVIIVIISLWSFESGRCSAEALAPALYVLGDSLVDTGNNNYLNVLFVAKANYRPYGIDLPFSFPTGRVTNGRTVPDMIATYLDLPYPRRIKQPSLRPSLKGYNYASAGCGILPETGPKNCLPMEEQVRLFEETKENVLRAAFDEAQLEHHLANSIFFIWAGNNDYLLNYFLPGSNSSQDYTPEQFADHLSQQLSQKLEALHSLGARKIVVYEVPPFGCIPFYYEQTGACVTSRNENAVLYNTKLQEVIQSLSTKLNNPYFTLGKAYDLTYDAINNPAEYGFTNVTGSCCETGQVSGQKLVQCKPFPLDKVCEDRTKYLFWDGAHPTQAGNQVLGGQCISNSAICTPHTIEDLAKITITPSLLTATS